MKFIGAQIHFSKFTENLYDMEKVLGLDLGTNSIGWAIVQHNDDLSYTLLDKGVNIFQDGVAHDKSGEKPMVSDSRTISCGIYIIRRRQLIELIEKSAREDHYNFVTDILIRYKNVKRIYGYKMDSYWNNIASVESYYEANMDFLKPEIRDYFFRQYPDIYSRAGDLPPAKYNVGAQVKNSLVSSGSIINGIVEDSILFRKTYIGNNCYIKNSIILNDVYIGDNTHIENCIVESRDTIRANSYYKGEGEIKIIIEESDRYVM